MADRNVVLALVACQSDTMNTADDLPGLAEKTCDSNLRRTSLDERELQHGLVLHQAMLLRSCVIDVLKKECDVIYVLEDKKRIVKEKNDRKRICGKCFNTGQVPLTGMEMNLVALKKNKGIQEPLYYLNFQLHIPSSIRTFKNSKGIEHQQSRSCNVKFEHGHI